MTLLVMTNAAVVVGCMLALWLLSLLKSDASIVDTFWGPGFAVVAWLTWWQTPTPRAVVMAALVTLWGVRLALHIGLRNAGKPEDVRYQGLRARWAPFWWKSLFVVFLLQGGLLMVVSAPIAVAAAGPADVTALDVIGVALFAFGFLFEATADLQLVLFKRDQTNTGAVMDRGLWAWSRHPNYFGEMVLWWGLGLLALSAPHGWLALVGPVTITFLLLRVSGVPMLEASMKERRPAYVDYIARTSSFWPRPPRG